MSIFLPKNQQHKIKQQQQAERNRYNNMMNSLSSELVEWLKEKDLTVADFENLIGFTRSRFELVFGKTKIKDFKKNETN